MNASTLAYIQDLAARYKRRDCVRQAVLSLHRQWQTGSTPWGTEGPIPGYEAGWESRNRDVLPPGFSYSNIVRRIVRISNLNALRKFRNS